MKKLPVILVILILFLVAGTVIYKKSVAPRNENTAFIEEESSLSEKDRENEARRILKESHQECNRQHTKVNEIVKRCRALPMGPERTRCMEEYDVVYKRVRKICDHETLDAKGLRSIRYLWELQLKKCNDKRVSRCAAALHQLGRYQFLLEEKTGNDHDKSLEYFLEYIDTYPLEHQNPSVLYQAAEILEAKGEDKKARNFYERLIENFPNHALATKARTHLGL